MDGSRIRTQSKGGRRLFLQVRRIFLLLWIGTAVCMLSCGPKQPVSVFDQKAEPGAEQLFQGAQARIARGEDAEALSLYQEYLNRFSSGPRAPEALLKTAEIQRRMGRFQESRQAYQRFLEAYPDSPPVPEAMMALLEMDFQEGNYREALRQASQILARPVPRPLIFKTYELLGDTHMAMGAPADSVFFYTMADHQADSEEKPRILSKLKQAVRQLPAKDISALLARLGDPLPLGYLYYQQGLNEIQEGNFSHAARSLEEFLEKFPDHEYSPDAKALIEELRQSQTYRKYSIGCLLPLSGSYKIYGWRALKGIELALHRVSQNPDAPPWRLVIRDSGSDGEQSMEAVREFYKEKVAVIIGPIIAAEPAAQEAQALGIPIVTLSQKEEIPQLGSYVLRNFMTPLMQTQSLVSYAVRERKAHRFAILYPEETYGTTFMNDFWDQVIRLGGTVVAAESYDVEQTDFAVSLRKLTGLEPDYDSALMREDRPGEVLRGAEARFLEEMVLGVDDRAAPEPEGRNAPAVHFEDLVDPAPIVDFDALFIPDAPAKVGLIVPQLAYYDITGVDLLGTNLWHSDRLLEMAGQYLQGAVMADGFFAQSDNTPSAEFVTDFKRTFGEDAGFIEAVAYDSANMAFDALNHCQSDFRSDLRDELFSIQNYPAVTGPSSFDSSGEVHKKLYILQVRGRRFVELKTEH